MNLVFIIENFFLFACSHSKDTSTFSVDRSCNLLQYKCDSGQCIGKANVCDGKQHCNDGSDETICGEKFDLSNPKFICSL